MGSFWRPPEAVRSTHSAKSRARDGGRMRRPPEADESDALGKKPSTGCWEDVETAGGG